nr:cupin domain-containing protein [Streptomyces sabulosicollis]
MDAVDGTGPKMLADVKPPFIPEGASGMTVLVEWPPGHPGTPPHRHSGPCYGYVTEGAIRFELEGEPERVIKAGETLFEPGGDVIHYQNGNALSDAPSKFVVFMLCAPGQPMLTLVDEEELEERAHLRHAR